MRRAAIISLVLLWVWFAFTVSADYYCVYDTGFAVKESDVRRPGIRPCRNAKRELRLDFTRLGWLLLPPVLVSPLLRQFWRKEVAAKRSN